MKLVQFTGFVLAKNRLKLETTNYKVVNQWLQNENKGKSKMKSKGTPAFQGKLKLSSAD